MRPHEEELTVSDPGGLQERETVLRTLRNKLHQYGAMGAFKRRALENRE